MFCKSNFQTQGRPVIDRPNVSGDHVLRSEDNWARARDCARTATRGTLTTRPSGCRNGHKVSPANCRLRRIGSGHRKSGRRLSSESRLKATTQVLPRAATRRCSDAALVPTVTRSRHFAQRYFSGNLRGRDLPWMARTIFPDGIHPKDTKDLASIELAKNPALSDELNWGWLKFSYPP